MEVIGWIVFGLVVGVIAKFLMPGKDPGGFMITVLLGILGSFVGGFLGQVVGGSGQASGWIGSIVGAMLLLLIYRMMMGPRGPQARTV